MLRSIVGTSSIFYLANILGLETNKIAIKDNANFIYQSDGVKYQPNSVSNNSNAYGFNVYDSNYSLIRQLPPSRETVKADNLKNCSALVIGDSTVSLNTMTQKMLDIFTEKGKTLTLLGTRGTAPNLHEGRGGGSTKEYATMSTAGGHENAFYNPNTQKFDFSYYMTNQGYSSVDFVIIQLGINDLYQAKFETSQTTIEETSQYLKAIVESIFTFNPTQKIIINLPTPPNGNETILGYKSRWQIANMFVRYNEYVQVRMEQNENIHCSYCHLILNPNTDINDNVHPNESGFEKMAMETVNQINFWQN
jgi:hypothetical protein